MKPLSQTASAKWKRRNKTHVTRKLKEWLIRKAEHRAVWTKQYLARTKERRRVYDADRNFKLRDDPAIKARKSAYMAKWLPINRHRALASYSKRKALKRGNQLGDQKLIAAWFKSWRSKRRVICFWCRKLTIPANCHGDHIIPLAKGGAHAIENMCVSCADCNQHKHDKSISTWNQQIAEPVLL